MDGNALIWYLLWLNAPFCSKEWVQQRSFLNIIFRSRIWKLLVKRKWFPDTFSNIYGIMLLPWANNSSLLWLPARDPAKVLASIPVLVDVLFCSLQNVCSNPINPNTVLILCFLTDTICICPIYTKKTQFWQNRWHITSNSFHFFIIPISNTCNYEIWKSTIELCTMNEGLFVRR